MAPPENRLYLLRVAMLVIAMLLPVGSLIVLGSIWLWQNSLLLYWAMAAALVTLSIYAIESWIIGPGAWRSQVREAGAETVASTEPSPTETLEDAARADVLRIADSVQPADLDNRDKVLALGVRTLEAVARRLHPGERHPLWKFTVPQAMALLEQVSRRFGQFVSTSVPFGERLTMGQLLRIYRWRAVADIAEKAYDIWRVVRLINPAAAIATEMREKVVGQLYERGRDEIAKRIARAYVKAVGDAALDLYSGRLRAPDMPAVAISVPASKQEPPSGASLPENNARSSSGDTTARLGGASGIRRALRSLKLWNKLP